MNVQHLIFDLDNTLYPSSGAMDKGITKRMMTFVAKFFGIGYEDAVSLRAEKIQNFSTTLEWLRSEGLCDVEAYFRAVHPENEADEVEKSEKLRPFLEAIKMPKVILTNAPSEHAERVLNKLEVRDLFCGICDIRKTNFLGKPYPEAYKVSLKMMDATVDDTIFLDDMQKYTDGYEALGGTAILIGDKNGRPLNKEANAVTKITPSHSGKTIRIKTIYELHSVLS